MVVLVKIFKAGYLDVNTILHIFNHTIFSFVTKLIIRGSKESSGRCIYSGFLKASHMGK